MSEAESWFDVPGADKEIQTGKRPSAAKVDAFRAAASTALASATASYAKKRAAEADGDVRFMDQMIKSGTAADQVAAMTLRIQASPVHELTILDALLKLCGRGNHRGARLALEALVDPFKSNLLPPDRLLIPLEARPLKDHGVGEGNDNQSKNTKNSKKKKKTQEESDGASSSNNMSKLDVLWCFEAELKARFSQLLQHITAALNDNSAEYRKFAVDLAANLLESRPEQESTLLSMCVNKLGDRDRKVASRAMYRLQLLLQAHSAMAHTIVKYVQSFFARPHLPPRALYNGIVFLNQIYIGRGDSALAASLVSTYLGLFERAVEAGNLKSRLLAALLTGVARAQPYIALADLVAGSSSSSSSSSSIDLGSDANGHKRKRGGTGDSSGEEEESEAENNGTGEAGEGTVLSNEKDAAKSLHAQIGTIFRMVHVGNFSASTQALSILHHFVNAQ